MGGGYCYCDHAPNMVNPFPDYFDIYGVPVSNICTRTCDAPYDKENCGGSGTLANGLNYELSTIYRVGRHDSNPGNCNNTQNLIVDGEFDLGCSTGGCIGAGSVKSNSWRSWTINFFTQSSNSFY